MKKKPSWTLLALLALLGAISLSHAQVIITSTDSFTGNNSSFSIDFTSIGNATNAADTTGYGAVGYNYSIGTYTISQNQINAAGISGVTAGAWSGLQPAANITWYQAAAFVNFLNTSSGYHTAYNLSGVTNMSLWTTNDAGYNAANSFRNTLAKFVLPSENEWYKAAYGLSNGSGYTTYTTASNTAPTAVASGTNAGTAVYNSVASVPAAVNQAGGGSSYGTMGQGGNIFQWEEGNYSGTNNDPNGTPRGIRGGYWGIGSSYLLSSDRNFDDPASKTTYLGFRVAELSSVPEPSSYALCLLAGVIVLVAARSRRAL